MGIEYVKIETKKVTTLKANIVNTIQEAPKKRSVLKRTSKTKTE